MLDLAAHSNGMPKSWKSLQLSGGIAAMLAGIVFRRNLGAELALFSAIKPPNAIHDWFVLLQTHRLLGLVYLGIFDIINALLIGLLLLALYAALCRSQPGFAAVAAVCGFTGIAVYLSSNTALSMLALSNQYASMPPDSTTQSEAQRTLFLAAGQALLALNRFGSAGAQPGSGGYLSLFLIALSGLIFSTAMLRDHAFHRPTAYTGILANGLDLLYCVAYPFVPAAASEQLAVLFIPAAGLGFMVWHIMIGWGLVKSARRSG